MIKFFFLCSLFISTIFCSPKKIILEDNLSPTVDKISHSTTSFGLYYTFRYFGHKKVKSIALSFGLGLVYEIYQIYDPLEQEYFRGVSLHDIFYNLIGISSAVIIDSIIMGKKEKDPVKSFNLTYSPLPFLIWELSFS